MSSDHACSICREPGLLELEGFGALPRVTSDTKPFPAGGRLAVCRACAAVQKIPDDRWHEEIAAIYGAYDMYAQSGGSEQRVFDPVGGSTSRSGRLLGQALRSIELPETGCLLDVGCGTGATLEAFAERISGWRLFGQDLDGRYRERLEGIAGFERLVHRTLDPELPRCDLVTLIHSLEHIPDPRAALLEIGSVLRPSGWLLAQVPDAAVSPFDLLVADHLCHFDACVLAHVAESAGYRVESCGGGWVSKELSLLARPGEPSGRPGGARGEARVKARVESQIAWLRGVLDAARASARSGRPFAIFGTAIAGTWLLGALDGVVDLLVDEDRSRVGREHCGCPIVAPRDVPAGTQVYVPLIPPVARAVVDRYAHLPVRWITPPPLAPGRGA